MNCSMFIERNEVEKYTEDMSELQLVCIEFPRMNLCHKMTTEFPLDIGYGEPEHE